MADPAFDSHVIVYVGVDNVEAALQEAERLSGTRRLGLARSPESDLVIGHSRTRKAI